MCRVEQAAAEFWRVNQLQLYGTLHCPAAHEHQRSQASGVDLLNLGEIEYEHAETVELLNPAPELVERGSTDHAPGTLHDGHIFYAFDLVLKFHTFIHTHQPLEKFPNCGLLYRRENGKNVTTCEIEGTRLDMPWWEIDRYENCCKADIKNM